MSEAFRDLLAITKTIYGRELERAMREHSRVPHPEYVDQPYNEAKQIYELVLRMKREAEVRLFNEVARGGT